MKSKLAEIDPALNSLEEFSKLSCGTVSTIDKMRKNVLFTDAKFEKKYKVLGALLWSISEKCEPCIKFYVMKAKEFGVSKEELGEYLSIASTMGGCVGEMWALKAFTAFLSDKGSEACCPV